MPATPIPGTRAIQPGVDDPFLPKPGDGQVTYGDANAPIEWGSILSPVTTEKANVDIQSGPADARIEHGTVGELPQFFEPPPPVGDPYADPMTFPGPQFPVPIFPGADGTGDPYTGVTPEIHEPATGDPQGLEQILLAYLLANGGQG